MPRASVAIRDDVTSGTALAISIRTTGLFPTMLLQMTAIGEESGSLDDMLGKVADHYEAAVDNAVDSLSSLMEPMIMSILGRTGWRTHDRHVPADFYARLGHLTLSRDSN